MEKIGIGGKSCQGGLGRLIKTLDKGRQQRPEQFPQSVQRPQRNATWSDGHKNRKNDNKRVTRYTKLKFL